MICEHCKKEIRPGSIYCEHCGTPVQIVPDYSILDEDILPEFVEDPEEKKRRQKEQLEKERRAGQRPEAVENAPKNGKKTSPLVLSMLLLFAVAFSLLTVIFYPRMRQAYYLSRAAKAMEAERYQEALDFYESAGDESIPIRLSMAELRYKLGQYDASINAVRSLLSEEIEDPEELSEAYRLLIRLYGATGNYIALRALAEEVPTEELRALFSEYVLATVLFSEESGSYTDDITLSLAAWSDTPYEIYYTLDGTEPGKNTGILYTEPFLLTDGTTTVKAACVDERGHKGETVTNTYQIRYEAPSLPVVSPRSGTFSELTYLTITVPEGQSVYYTWNGAIPNPSSPRYTGPIPVPEGNNILSVIAIDTHGLTSEILRLNYEYLPTVESEAPSEEEETPAPEEAADTQEVGEAVSP